MKNNGRKQRVHIIGSTCQVTKVKKYELIFTDKKEDVTCVTCLKGLGIEPDYRNRYRAKVHHKELKCGRTRGWNSSETMDESKVTCSLCIKRLEYSNMLMTETDRVRQALKAAGYI